MQGLQGYEQFVRGFDTNYPAMKGFYGAAQSRTKTCINYVLNPEHRRVQVSGTNQTSLESNADYHVEGLGNTLPPNLDHLPVVDANDLRD